MTKCVFGVGTPPQNTFNVRSGAIFAVNELAMFSFGPDQLIDEPLSAVALPGTTDRNPPRSPSVSVTVRLATTAVAPAGTMSAVVTAPVVSLRASLMLTTRL